MKVLILGANGFIGSAIAARLLDDGHAVIGLGRNIGSARFRLPGVEWRRRDLAKMRQPGDWRALLDGVDAVVNAAGALQQSRRDDLAATQLHAMLALYQAATECGVKRVVQISARTDGPGEETAFLATKAGADAALADSGLDHVVLRPGLVLGRNAHGGSAMLRAIAAFPAIMPVHAPDAPIRTADLDDLCDTVAAALVGRFGTAGDVALAAPDTVRLETLVGLHRAWLGLPPAPTWQPPAWLVSLAARLADMAGQLGWRSPMRSTALKILAGGIDTATAGEFSPSRNAAATLAANPAGAQDLWFARLYLLKPVIIVTLALFWLVTGLIALARLEIAALVLGQAGIAPALVPAIAIATGLLDCMLGMAVLWRPAARAAMLAMIAVATAYLVIASLLAPALWLDPLGPLVKVIPAMVLTVAGLAVLDER